MGIAIGNYHDISFEVIGGDMSNDEIKATIEYFKEKYPDRKFTAFEFILDEDGEHVDVKYRYDSEPVERIRRVTGYLVGTLDRFNDAKRAEVADRVKHM